MQVSSAQRDSYNGLIGTLSSQELQTALLPAALRMVRR